MTAAAIRILLVDDHAIVRAGYQTLFAKQAGLTVVAEAESAVQAYRLYQQHQPNVVVTDLSLNGCGGLELIARIVLRSRKARILVFTMHQNPAFAVQSARAGALGYVTKSSPPEVLLRAIREVHGGRRFLSADIAQQLALEKLGGNRTALETLTTREFEILRLLVEARSTDDIAQLLNISPKTVCNCHYLIKRKLNVANDIELTRLAIRLNVVDLLELSGSEQEAAGRGNGGTSAGDCG